MAIKDLPKPAIAKFGTSFRLATCAHFVVVSSSLSAVCSYLDLQPDDAAALTARGYSYRKLGRFPAACDDYTRAILLQPSAAKLYNYRAYCLAKMGSYREAIRDYSAVLSMDGVNAHAFHNRCGGKV